MEGENEGKRRKEKEREGERRREKEREGEREGEKLDTVYSTKLGRNLKYSCFDKYLNVWETCKFDKFV